MRALFTLLLVAALLYAVPVVSSQETAPEQRVVLVDGTVLVGHVEDRDADPVVICQADGTEFRISQARIREMGALVGGRFSRADPSASRLFFAPTARTLGRGNGRLGSYFIFPVAAFAPADGVDLQATGTIPITIGQTCPDDGSACDDGPFGLVGFSLKGQVYRGERVAVALGASAITAYGVGDANGYGGTLFAAATYGTAAAAVTAGLTGFYGSGSASRSVSLGADLAPAAMLTLGLERQTSPSSKLISETHVLVQTGYGTGGSSINGFRFFGDRLSADVALVAVFGDGGGVAVMPIPYLAFSYAF